MFENGKEILLYSTIEELAEHIEHIRADRQFAQQIAINVQEKVRKWHTTEKRMQQVLHWLKHNESPSYGINY